MDECNSAIILTKDTLRIGIDNMGVNINSSADDYSEIFSFDGEAVLTAGDGEVGKIFHYINGKFHESIMVQSIMDI